MLFCNNIERMLGPQRNLFCLAIFFVWRCWNSGTFANSAQSLHELEHKTSCLNIREHFLTAQVMERCHGLPRQVVDFSLGIFKSHLDVVLGTLLWGALSRGYGPYGLPRSLPTPTVLWDAEIQDSKPKIASALVNDAGFFAMLLIGDGYIEHLQTQQSEGISL